MTVMIFFLFISSLESQILDRTIKANLKMYSSSNFGSNLVKIGSKNSFARKEKDSSSLNFETMNLAR